MAGISTGSWAEDQEREKACQKARELNAHLDELDKSLTNQTWWRNGLFVGMLPASAYAAILTLGGALQGRIIWENGGWKNAKRLCGPFFGSLLLTVGSPALAAAGWKKVIYTYEQVEEIRKRMGATRSTFTKLLADCASDKPQAR